VYVTVKLTDWIVQWRSDISALQVATSDAHCAIWFGNSDAIHCTPSSVNYGTRNKQSTPRNKFIGMTRFYDLNLIVETKTTVKHIVTMKSLRTLKNL